MNTKLNINAIEPGSITLDLLNDDVIQNMPIVKGDVENSAILFKGEYDGYCNTAISKTSIAIGAGTTAGLKGWYYSEIEFGSNPVITLSDIQPKPVLGSLVMGEWTSGTPNILEGDKVSIVNNAKYDYCGEVKSISENKITLKSALPFNTLDVGNIPVNNPDDWSIYLPDKESAGIIDFGGGALSEGVNTKSTNIGSHAEGIQTHAYGQYSHTEGRETEAGYAAHAEGSENIASGNASHAEGYLSSALSHQAHTEGWRTNVKKDARAGHAEGYNTVVGGEETTLTAGSDTSNGVYSHAEGNATQAIGYNSHSEGKLTKALGNISHAEGNQTIAKGGVSHAEGLLCKAEGYTSHAEGNNTHAYGSNSHAEGEATYAGANRSHAEGYGTKALNMSEHASGKYNQSIQSNDTSQATHFSIGIGTSDTNRKNAFEVKQNGDIYIEGIEGRIQDKLNTPNWNAQAGEAGYIENKPCYVNLNNGIRLTLDYADIITLSTDQKRYEKIIFLLNEFVISLYFYDFNGELRHYVLTEGQSVYDSHFGCNFTAVLNEYDLYNLVLTDFSDNKEYVDNTFAETNIVYEYNNEIIEKLNSIYLPDTVLKTTPQTLSTADKNQALANLGIADIARKSELTELLEEVGNKQDKATLATVATSGSYDDLSNKPTIPSEYKGNYSTVVLSPSSTSFTLSPNTYYTLSPSSSSAIAFTLGSAVSGITNEYIVEIDMSSYAPSIAFPTDVQWANENIPAFVAGKSYIISIVNNLAIFAEF